MHHVGEAWYDLGHPLNSRRRTEMVWVFGDVVRPAATSQVRDIMVSLKDHQERITTVPCLLVL